VSKKKILFVDDETSFCRAVQLNLEHSGGYEVTTESNSNNVLEAALNIKPDLIVLDYIMPELNGADVAVQLRNNADTKDIPIIFLTALATNNEMQNHEIISQYNTLSKPVSIEQLVNCIEKVTGESQ